MKIFIKITLFLCVSVLLVTFYYGGLQERTGFVSVLLVGLILLLSKTHGVVHNASIISLIVISAYFGADVGLLFLVILVVMVVLFSMFFLNMELDEKGRFYSYSGESQSSKNTFQGNSFGSNNVAKSSMRSFQDPSNVVNPSTTGLGHRGVNGMPNQFNINQK
ncbi:hypothetical protein HGT70_14555 [Rosenbergiella collisarenosi]|uniref:hypothetical protein n=1 Tax=Rosenbergiella collisarenosi TaxID=1544695 RepID=UPI001BD9147D|nr:hypothetical protein [Rosenbergiella collisarenosi]MBT0722492.1 hypothetical protein [Rosenbergiella collisarenosi]